MCVGLRLNTKTGEKRAGQYFDTKRKRGQAGNKQQTDQT